MKGLLLTGLLAITTLCLHAVEISNREGIIIEVEILVIDDTRIQIQMANGQSTWLDRARLSEESQKMIKDKETREQNAHEALNELLGINLFTDSNLWNDPSAEVAERLSWPHESKQTRKAVFVIIRTRTTVYCKLDPTQPLYAEDGKVQHVSIVFANKGTSNSVTRQARAKSMIWSERLNETLNKSVISLASNSASQIANSSV